MERTSGWNGCDRFTKGRSIAARAFNIVRRNIGDESEIGCFNETCAGRSLKRQRLKSLHLEKITGSRTKPVQKGDDRLGFSVLQNAGLIRG